jgi:hypothetical protein
MTASRESIRFYWKVVEHFRRKPGLWEIEFSEWTVRSPWPSTRHRLLLRVDLDAGRNDATGRFVMTARVGVKGGTSVEFSRAAADELSALSRVLQKRRYSLRPPMAYFPMSAWKKVTPRTFASEREFLSKLAGGEPGDTAGRTPTSLDEFLDSLRGKSAGDWCPLLAAWQYRKPIHIAGRPATAILKLHIAPYDRGVLGAASSVTIWPWSGAGALPAWLRKSRRTLDRQFRAAGHKMEWFRGPRRRGLMVTSMREGLGTLVEVGRERRVLEAMHLGDESTPRQ